MTEMLSMKAVAVLAAVPDPGNGRQPPGGEKILTILQWSAWLALAICVVGVIVAGGTMAVQHRHGGGGEHAAKLGWVFGGCIVVGSASALVSALV